MLIIIIFIGVVGFKILEGYTIGEAFYMTIITISTVGFNEVRPLSQTGRIFTAILIIFSFGTFAYAVTSITYYVLGGEFNRYFKDLRVNKRVDKISNHTIICGYGRNGKQAVSELLAHHKSYVLVEQDPTILEMLREAQTIPFIEGD